jgi:hypothetical protein
MGLRQMLRRRSTIPTTDALGIGGGDSDGETGEDGAPYLAQELAELRWAAQTEAVNLTRRGVDPTRWDGGRVYFDIERALAHSHEGLRDRLANIVGARIRDESTVLIPAAAQVAVALDALRASEAKLATVTRDLATADEKVRSDQLEGARFARLLSPRYRVGRYAIAAIFILTEFIISGLIFDRALHIDIPGLGYVFAMGLMVLLVVVPHFAAQGLKEGITHYHQYVRDDLIANKRVVPAEINRGVHLEERDDRGFRIVSIVALALLGALIVALAWLRAQDMPDPFILWFLFFALLQTGISAYFFLREWLDYGVDSHALIQQGERHASAQLERDGLFEDYAQAVEDYLVAAEPIAMTIQQAPRWDSFVVENYNATIRYMRHLVSIEQPEAEQFITWAAVPYLGSRHDEEPTGYKLEPVADENNSLNHDDLRGREHWYKVAAQALEEARLPTGAIDENSSPAEERTPSASWYVERNPRTLLAELLTTYFGLPADYVAEQLEVPGRGSPAEPEQAPDTQVPADDATGPTMPQRPGLRRVVPPPETNTSDSDDLESTDSKSR